MTEVLQYAAFTVDGRGGNPAGLVLDASGLNSDQMQEIAAQVGYSGTAFLTVRPQETNAYDVRYFAPLQEVPFCGHATIAAAVALSSRCSADEFVFHTPAGYVSVNTNQREKEIIAELTSVSPRSRDAPADLVAAALTVLRWEARDLHPAYPPALANAGAEHLILVTATHERLADLDYDVEAAATLMRTHGLVTLQLMWPESKHQYHSRNPFPSGGVVEDPATGAAAAAFGGYLRHLGKIGPTARFSISQGVELGRPSKLEVSVLRGEPGVRVSGAAAPIPDAPNRQ